MLHKTIERYKSGIYQIRNLVNNKKYVGSSVNIYNRFHTHCNKLKYKTHSNKHLESAYHYYGYDNFIFEVLEYCNEEILQIEQLYIDKIEPEYNKRIDATSNVNLIVSNETKLKISKTLKNAYKNGYKGYKQEKLNKPIDVFDRYGNYLITCKCAKDFSTYVGYNGNYDYKLIESRLIFKGYQAKLKDSNKIIYSYILDYTITKQEIAYINIETKEIMLYPNILTMCEHNNLDLSNTRKVIFKNLNPLTKYKYCLLSDDKYKLYNTFNIVNKFSIPSPE